MARPLWEMAVLDLAESANCYTARKEIGRATRIPRRRALRDPSPSPLFFEKLKFLFSVFALGRIPWLSWEARKWHTYATFVRFCICNVASMTMFRAFNDMLLHFKHKRFARHSSSETNFWTPQVAPFQSPSKNARFIAMGAPLFGKVALPLQRGAYLLKAGFRAFSPSFFIHRPKIAPRSPWIDVGSIWD